MPCPHPTVPSPMVALAVWCPLSPSGAQITQLLLEPPWRPAVLWDRVTLSCQGSGTTSDTTWYKDRQRWGQNGPNNFTVTKSGIYTCDRPGSGLSPPVKVSDDSLVLQVQMWPLLEGDRVTLCCRGRQNLLVTEVKFYHGDERVGWSHRGTKLSLSPLQLHHNGRYHCKCHVHSGIQSGWRQSESETMRVYELFTVPVLKGRTKLTEGSSLNLTCLSTPSPLEPQAPLVYFFYWDGLRVGGPQVSPQLLVPAVGVSHSGKYSCQVRSNGVAVQKSSGQLHVTVHTPVASVTITPSPPAHQVCAGDPVTLRCSVKVGSAPVNFTWLHNGREVAQGPVLELGDVDVGHSGTYQCVATIQLGQDGHHVFRALSPELTLEVTPQEHWKKAVATGVGVSLLFLLLLVGVAVGCHRWNNMTARNHQERAFPEPLASPGEDPQVTYMELQGTHGQAWEPSDIYDNLQQQL
ncbi:Fc receptor-like protein 4 [Sylvia atricapilla]|uniref:Fc receptor-like protein 4 n=1 Tax=Sylvia atricapilla TaxID=48155 RepID=UPI003394B2B4